LEEVLKMADQHRDFLIVAPVILLGLLLRPGGPGHAAAAEGQPLRDHCADALMITSVPFAPPATSTVAASSSPDDPLQSCSYDGASANTHSVWYAYTPECDGILTVSTAGSDYDTVLTVYSGSCGQLTELDCNDDAAGLQSRIDGLNVQGGTALLIEVTRYTSAEGGFTLDFLLDLECYGPPTTPSNPLPTDGARGVVLNPTLSWDTLGLATARAVPKVIYGEDDRLDEYQITDSAVLQLGDATAVFVSPANLANNGDGTVTIWSGTYGETNDLCPGEPFHNQPDPGFCTGFLVSPNVMATAGHCITDDAECAGTAIVFGFVMLDAYSPATTVDASEVYYCSRVLARDSGTADWALLELDRPVSNHRPLAIRTSGKITDAEPLLVIGYPAGLPRKYADGAFVRSNSGRATFEANLDVYAGNSGSPVFSRNTLLVEGLLIGGEDDFTYVPPPDDCWVSTQCSDNGCLGESVTRATEFAGEAPLMEYDVHFGTCSSLEFRGTTQVPTWEPGVLQPATTYCWKIVARNELGETIGPQWRFTTSSQGTLPSCDPCALEFGESDKDMSFDVWNAGEGTWEFTVTPQEGWLSADPTVGSSSGPSDPVTITVAVNRSGLATGIYRGTISVGDLDIEVDMTSVTEQRPTCEPCDLSFGETANQLSFLAYNAGTDLWQFDVAPSQSWITVNPTSGSSSGPEEQTTIVVTVDRTGLSPGSYAGTVDLGSLTIDVSMRIPGSNGCGTLGLITMAGVGSGFLALIGSRRTRRS
jgi:hypothetical protein